MGDQVGMKRIMDEVQRMADEYGVTINLKDFTIDRASYEAAMTDFVSGTQFGDVDLNHRARVTPRMMQEFYPDFDGDYATLYS